MIITFKALPADREKLNRLLYASKDYWNYGPAFMAKFMALFALTEEYIINNEVIIAQQADNIIGFYSFRRAAPSHLELDCLFLHPDFIGQGLGTQLWKMICAQALSLGYNEFILWSDPHAEGFYYKMGCEKIDVGKSILAPNRYLSIMKYVIRS